MLSCADVGRSASWIMRETTDAAPAGVYRSQTAPALQQELCFPLQGHPHYRYIQELNRCRSCLTHTYHRCERSHVCLTWCLQGRSHPLSNVFILTAACCGAVQQRHLNIFWPAQIYVTAYSRRELIGQGGCCRFLRFVTPEDVSADALPLAARGRGASNHGCPMTSQPRKPSRMQKILRDCSPSGWHDPGGKAVAPADIAVSLPCIHGA